MLVGRAWSTSRLIWKQNVVKINMLVCNQDFAGEQSDLKFKSFMNWKPMEVS